MEILLEKIIDTSIDFGIKILTALVLLVICLKVIKIFEKYLKKDHRFSKLDPSVKMFVVSFVVIGLKVLLFITILTIIGIPMTSLITILGSCALAVGLALQGGLSNLAGGLMILIFKPFKIGDYIEVNGKEGKVKSITLFYTTAISSDNKTIQLPNGSLSNSNITNFTANKTRMLEMNVSVKYNSDIETVKKVLLNAVNKTDLVLKDENILIRMKDYTDTSATYIVKVWTNTSDYSNATFDLKENIKIAIDENKI